MALNFRSFFKILLASLATIACCITIHEAGHAIASWFTGGRVTEFVILSRRPHVHVVGPSSSEQRAIRAVAGTGALLVAWFSCMLAVPAAATRILVFELAFFYSEIELLAWTLSSIFYPGVLRGEDAAKFIRYSGADPKIVALGCIVIAALSVAGFCWRRDRGVHSRFGRIFQHGAFVRSARHQAL